MWRPHPEGVIIDEWSARRAKGFCKTQLSRLSKFSCQLQENGINLLAIGMKIITIPILTLTLVFILISAARSQPLDFVRYTTPQGLVQSQVLDICQDQEGFLWVATLGGI